METKESLANLLEMSYSRDDFQVNIRARLYGAIGEYYKSVLADKNDLSTHPKKSHLIDHWMNETFGLLTAFQAAIEHSTKFNDKLLAVSEIIEEIKQKDLRFQTKAYTYVCKCFPDKSIKKLIDERDTEEFWQLVQNEIDEADM